MSPWEAALLGFVQGATEFLPVSSSGHLVMGQFLLDIQVSGVQFEIAVHLATLVSVIWVYRSRLVELARGAFTGDRDAWAYIGLLGIATIPAAVIGVGLGDVLERWFDVPHVTGVALLGTAALLWSSTVPLGHTLEKKPGMRDAILIGLAQCFALIPGVSRSGSTVVTALWLGIDAREAAQFSFLMAIPAILGAAVLQVPDVVAVGGLDMSAVSLGVGAAVAAITGVAAIRTFVALLAKKGFYRFGHYCFVVGALFLLYLTFFLPSGT